MVSRQTSVFLASAGLLGLIGLSGCRTTGYTVSGDSYSAVERPIEGDFSTDVARTDEDQQPAVARRPVQPVPYEEPIGDGPTSDPTASVPVPSPPVATVDQRVTILQELGATIEVDGNGEPIAVEFANALVTETELATLATMTKITQLNLRGSSITDEGLGRLLTLENLKLLDLGNTGITDAGLVVIGDMTTLEYLLLGQTRITDDGLASLASLKNLQGLSLVGISLSRGALDNLRTALPNCQIVADAPAEQDAPATSAVEVLGPSTVVEADVDSAPVPNVDSEVARPLLAPGPSTPERDNGIRSLFEGDNRQTAPLLEPEVTQKQTTTPISVVRATRPGSDEETLIQYRLGVEMARRGEMDAALPHLVAAVGKAEAHFTLGVIEYQNALEAGRRQFTKALEFQSEYDEARFWLNEVNRQQSRTPRLDNPFQVVRSYDLLPLPMISPTSRPSHASPQAGELRHATLTTAPAAR